MTDGRFEGHVALITGGASGIGEACARAFTSESAAVVILDVDEATGLKTVEKIADAGGQVELVVGDVRVPEDCDTAVATAVSSFGGLDIVFCNAGVFHPGTVETQSLESWAHQVDVILRGTFLTCRYAVPALRARGGGAIVLSGSNCSHIGCSGRFAYTAAKAAMPVLAKQLSNDYFHTAGIRVNCVSPGYVLTPMTENIWRQQTNAPPDAPLPPETFERWQTPESIAAAVLFLVSAEAADITGVTLPVSRTGLLRVAAQRMA